MSGWIKLHRQFKDHGHFHMPDRALKIWLYILMTVSHRDQPQWRVKRGAGWISYDMISDACSEIRDDGTVARMTHKSIAAALKWLEENGYIERFVIKGKGQQIYVPNYDKYQATESATSQMEEVAEEPREEVGGEVREDIQEVKELKEPKKIDPPYNPPAEEMVAAGEPDIPFGEIVDHLNERAGKQYRSTTAATRRHITARWREGYTLDDFHTVIDKKVAAWMGTDMEQFLRPQTLFGTKFESYLNEPWPGAVRSRAAPLRAVSGESAVTRRLRELGVTFNAGA